MLLYTLRSFTDLYFSQIWSAFLVEVSGNKTRVFSDSIFVSGCYPYFLVLQNAIHEQTSSFLVFPDFFVRFLKPEPVFIKPFSTKKQILKLIRFQGYSQTSFWVFFVLYLTFTWIDLSTITREVWRCQKNRFYLSLY